MAFPRLSREAAEQVVATMEGCLSRGVSYSAAHAEAAKLLKLPRGTVYSRLHAAESVYGLTPRLAQPKPLTVPELPPEPPPSPFAVQHEAPPIGTSAGARWEFVSRSDNTFRFGAFGDLHAASKYTRYEVREDLTRRAERFGAQAILDTGNWIDGEKPFNRYDLEAVGLDAQVQCLAKRYPRTDIPTYAVTGADHEGWYVKSEGIDVGRYCESVMREAGHKWTCLGYMEADIVLRNANSGATAILRVMHPGGGSSYALSYRPQKIIESFEGGEKPAVLLMGHYHKIDFGLVRNVWYCQTGTAQDQTPFMRQKSLEAHVGGFLIEMEQDPETGAIIDFTPKARRYFNRAYYFKGGQANDRWSGSGPIKQIPRAANIAE